MKLQIPKIDYKILCDQGDKRYKSELEKLKLAITDFGFLILQNHPITDKKINNTFSIYKEFFNLPFKQKNEINMSNTMSNRGWGATKSEQVSQNYNPDYKEIFDCGPSIKVNHQFKEMSYYSNNIWPKGIPDFESIVTSFYDSCNEIATSLLKNIEVSFNYSNNYFANKFNFPMALLRCNYYSARSSKLSKKDFGVAPHTDYGCLTLLFTDGTEGLEIQRPSNKWLKVVAPKHEIIVNFGEKISISGKKYDASNLLKLLSNKSETNQFKNFSKEVEVQIKNLTTKSNVPLNNFRLIALLEKGKFSKISSKSEFTKGKYLDVSLKKDPNNNKKILEVYSDIPQALLSDYKFFEGIKDGKLLYNSIIDETGSTSKLTIENFKVIKAPAFATLLTLADFGGVADLLSGQGMSFDVLEINLKDNTNVTIIEEILALGPSVSLHMKGYIEKKTGLISFNGTLVPAKMLNSLVSKIPVVGNILVGKKVGDGVFGVSFKIKGLPGKVKTAVNPVKTITPRFITRALEKIKKK